MKNLKEKYLLNITHAFIFNINTNVITRILKVNE